MSRNAIDLLRRSAERFPEKLALSDASKSVSYAELKKKAEQIGTALAQDKTFKKPIVVFCDREIESIISFWGVVESGNFYVPIDISTPISRIQLYISIVEPAAVIFRNKQKSRLSELELPDSVKEYDYDEMCETPGDVSFLDRTYRKLTMQDPLYLVFTSGSTGIPKGVLKTHRSLVSFIEEFVPLFDFNDEDVFGNQVSLDFDIAAKDIYTSASVGGTLHLIPSLCFVVPQKLPVFLKERKVNTLIWSVAAVNHVVNSGMFKCDMPKTIKKVMFSGEPLSVKVLNEWKRNIPAAVYVNLYAPSEVTGNCLYYTAETSMRYEERLPLGTPFPNMKVFLLNERLQIAQENEIGEIYISGEFLSSGYYNNMELTEKTFVQNPINKSYPEISYRTGDLARYSDGNLFFVSRKDYQIKHMGHRIELGEIESLANSIKDVENSSCFIDQDQQLILTVCGKNIEVEEIRKDLRTRLPKYMWPHQIFRIDEFPLTARGKADRVKIKEIYERGR